MRIVCFGGAVRAGSSSEIALQMAAQMAARSGSQVDFFPGAELDFPIYRPESTERDERTRKFVNALRQADGIIVATPGYHGSISGLLKNAIDYVEDLKSDERTYFSGRAVGVIVSAAGWQSVGSTLAAVRSIVHALRGWPTPYGVGINSREMNVGKAQAPNPALQAPISTMVDEVVQFAAANRSASYRQARAG
ncbi:NAD(P)H-dependent oxidoreductase [Paracoccus sp. (in: a-proteobacteria)]|uniref:NADPH-dependent FMN reductase n=1 Tax=Paracoccus sp. TaxID=267 RepID=UPI0032207741